MTDDAVRNAAKLTDCIALILLISMLVHLQPPGMPLCAHKILGTNS